MAISSSSSSSSRTRADYNCQILYSPLTHYYSTTTKTKTTSFASSSPVLARSQTTPRSLSYSLNLDRPASPTKKPCLCSPTNHPGSFRCAKHRNTPRGAAVYRPSLSVVRLMAMRNSMARIGIVEGDFVERAMASLVQTASGNLQRRRETHRPRPSRLSVMSRAVDQEDS